MGLQKRRTPLRIPPLFQGNAMINSVSFSSPDAHMAVGLSEGFAVYTTSPLSQVARCPFGGLATSCAVAFARLATAVVRGVPGQASLSDCDVCAWDWAGSRPLSSLQFPAPVRRIAADGDLFALAFDAEVDVYTTKGFAIALRFECARNPAAPCALGERSRERLLALTGRAPGFLKIISIDHVERKAIEFEVADHPLTMIRFNATAELVATASEKGTLARVFSSRTGQLIAEFRRGSFRATIRALSFSPSSDFLAVLSDKGTVHLFQVPESAQADPIRAAAKWTMEACEPSVVEFLGNGIFAVIRFKTGQMEILRYATDTRKITPHSKVVLANVGK
jgi:hypothetical protein